MSKKISWSPDDSPFLPTSTWRYFAVCEYTTKVSSLASRPRPVARAAPVTTIVNTHAVATQPSNLLRMDPSLSIRTPSSRWSMASSNPAPQLELPGSEPVATRLSSDVFRHRLPLIFTCPLAARRTLPVRVASYRDAHDATDPDVSYARERQDRDRGGGRVG